MLKIYKYVRGLLKFQYLRPAWPMSCYFYEAFRRFFLFQLRLFSFIRQHSRKNTMLIVDLLTLTDRRCDSWHRWHISSLMYATIYIQMMQGLMTFRWLEIKICINNCFCLCVNNGGIFSNKILTFPCIIFSWIIVNTRIILWLIAYKWYINCRWRLTFYYFLILLEIRFRNFI